MKEKVCDWPSLLLFLLFKKILCAHSNTDRFLNHWVVENTSLYQYPLPYTNSFFHVSDTQEWSDQLFLSRFLTHRSGQTHIFFHDFWHTGVFRPTLSFTFSDTKKWSDQHFLRCFLTHKDVRTYITYTKVTENVRTFQLCIWKSYRSEVQTQPQQQNNQNLSLVGT